MQNVIKNVCYFELGLYYVFCNKTFKNEKNLITYIYIYGIFTGLYVCPGI